MSALASVQTSNQQVAFTLLKAAKPLASQPGESPGTGDPVDKVDLSEIAKLAVSAKESRMLVESPTHAVILDDDGNMIGRILEGGGSVFSTDALMKAFGGPDPEEIQRRLDEAREKRIGSQGPDALMRFVYGDKFAAFMKDLGAAVQRGNPVEAVAEVVRDAKVGRVLFLEEPRSLHQAPIPDTSEMRQLQAAAALWRSTSTRNETV